MDGKKEVNLKGKGHSGGQFVLPLDKSPGKWKCQ